MTARVIPIRRAEVTPLCSHVAALVLAERAALALMCSPTTERAWRAELIRAAAAGDAVRATEAVKGWNDER